MRSNDTTDMQKGKNQINVVVRISFVGNPLWFDILKVKISQYFFYILKKKLCKFLHSILDRLALDIYFVVIPETVNIHHNVAVIISLQ